MKFQREIFQNLSDLILPYGNDENIFFDLPISCRDGILHWSQFLLAASSKLMKELLKNQEEPCLVLPDLDRKNVLDALENLFIKNNVTEIEKFEEVYDTLKFDVEKHISNNNDTSSKSAFKCSVMGCTVVFQRALHLERHLSSHNKNSQFVCEQCGKVFYHEDNLKLHMRYHEDILKVLTCQHCQSEFHGRRALQCHIDDQHAPQISCPICKKSFKKRMLLRHVRSKHAKDTNKKVNISSINIRLVFKMEIVKECRGIKQT